METIKIKRLCQEAQMPKRAHKTDAGFDLVATSKKQEGGAMVYGTGIALEIPEGYVGLLFPRSSISRTDLVLTNCVGVIDAGYRGEVMFKFKIQANFKEHLGTTRDNCQLYDVGDRIGQLIIVKLPDVAIIETGTLSDSERGTGGYGSTGK